MLEKGKNSVSIISWLSLNMQITSSKLNYVINTCALYLCGIAGRHILISRNKALSTRIRIFFKTEVFSPLLKKSRPHVAYSNRLGPSTCKRKNGGNMIAPSLESAHYLVI